MFHKLRNQLVEEAKKAGEIVVPNFKGMIVDTHWPFSGTKRFVPPKQEDVGALVVMRKRLKENELKMVEKAELATLIHAMLKFQSRSLMLGRKVSSKNVKFDMNKDIFEVRTMDVDEISTAKAIEKTTIAEDVNDDAYKGETAKVSPYVAIAL
ncbi:hypothetical protein LR48_Vigan10g234100 [Vigna angularis]|uniref:Uncharacterized protein n=1 Tax=Phaseolus angularis TaxID=3914 RepID=A0A0L9VP02_PHAAN|nr:hypothetical protein LR48_Vigan10g234100 [Vigna angularis]